MKDTGLCDPKGNKDLGLEFVLGGLVMSSISDGDEEDLPISQHLKLVATGLAKRKRKPFYFFNDDLE